MAGGIVCNRLLQLFVVAWLLLPSPARAATDAPAHVYENSLNQTGKLGSDLYQTLDEKYRKSIQKYEDEYFHGGIK
jgi:hypothetical protein